MKNAIVILLALALACIICSCTGNKDITSRLLQVEAQLDGQPDSAHLVALDGIKASGKLSTRQNALWCLLYTKALDKNHIVHTSDSLIQIAVRYFEKKNDSENLMKAYYYSAAVYHDLGDFPRAQDFYLRAAEAGKNSTNHALLGRIYANLGSMYNYQNLFETALAMQEKAVEHFSVVKDTTSLGMAFRNIGRVYTLKGQLDSAIIYYSEAIPFLTPENRSSIYNDIGGAYKRLSRYQEALENINLALDSFTETDDIFTIYYNLGDLYRLTGQYDSAFYYLSLCLTSPNIYTKAGANLNMAYLEEKRENWIASVRFLNQHMYLQDSINHFEQTENLQHIQSQYDYSQVEKERLFHEKESFKKTIYNRLLLACLPLVCLFAVLYHQRRKRILKHQHDGELRIQEQKHKQSREYIEEKEEENRRLKLAYEQETDQLHKELLAVRQQITSNEIENKKQEQALRTDLIHKFKTSMFLKEFMECPQRPSKEQWTEFDYWMEQIYPDMKPYLKNEIPKLDDEKLHFCYLVKIGASVNQMETLFRISSSAIPKRKNRLHKELSKEAKGNASQFKVLLDELFGIF